MREIRKKKRAATAAAEAAVEVAVAAPPPPPPPLYPQNPLNLIELSFGSRGASDLRCGELGFGRRRGGGEEGGMGI